MVEMVSQHISSGVERMKKKKQQSITWCNTGCPDSSQCGNTAAEMCCKCREAVKLKSHMQ